MPITPKEQKKVMAHSVNEKINNDSIYFTPGQITVNKSLKDGIRTFVDFYKYALLSIPDGIVLISIFYLINHFATVPIELIIIIPGLLIAFFAYFILISAPIANYYKSKIAKIRYCGIIKSTTSSVSILQPLGYTIVIAFISTAKVYGILNGFSILLLIGGIIFYFISINQAMIPYFLFDTNLNRSDAINRGWLLISNSNLKIAAINLLAFLPVIILFLLSLIFSNAYFLVGAFIAFIIVEGIWYGACASIHNAVSRGKKEYKIY